MAAIGKRERTTKDGKVTTYWYAQVYLGRHPVTGKPQNVSKTFKREGDAKKWGRAQESGKDRGEPPSTSKETLAEYIERWLLDHASQVRSVTIYNYRATLNRWILNPTNGAPPIGSIRLSKLTPKAINSLYRYMSEQGVQPRGVRNLHDMLRPALKAAVKAGDIPRNPVELATVPKADAHGERADEDAVVRTLDREQAEAFLKAAREDRYSALWHVLLTGGLRPCEAFALKWRNVDFEKGEVHVRRTLTRIGLKREQPPPLWKLTAPKTKKSRRTVPLPAITMRELRRWQTLQAWEQRTLQGEYQDHGFVFTTQIGSPLNLSNLCRHRFRRVMEAAGLGVHGPERTKPKGQPGPTARRFTPSHRIYDLRHTHATLLLMDGEDLLVVSRRLGHSTIKLTADTYAHVTVERSAEAAGRFDRMFGTA